jgi:hypothetical protein
MTDKTHSLPPGPRGGPGVLGPWNPERGRTTATHATSVAAAIFVSRFGSFFRGPGR